MLQIKEKKSYLSDQTLHNDGDKIGAIQLTML